MLWISITADAEYKSEKIAMNTTKDRNGILVEVGSTVRVLHIRDSVITRLTPTEAREIRSMKGEVLEVYEVDDWGSAGVKKWWKASNRKSFSHSLALTPDEMEIVT